MIGAPARGPTRSRAVGLLAWVVALLALAGPIGAAAAENAGPQAADARVSMSPEEASATNSPAAPSTQSTPKSADAPPLTRAAARQRVETISPVPWLARFGPVSLKNHE